MEANYNVSNKEDQIDNIMDFFDFGKVATVMNTLDWHWAHNIQGTSPDKDVSWVPIEPEIRQFARKLMKECFDRAEKAPEESRVSLSCGGFKAEINDGIMELSFVIAHWEGA